ncbi:MAG: hypothetical protein U9P90_02090 [Patescibacteria group bacterium]|nr:hypothetical protein [Patescibacteria group bacterium]
MLTSPKYLKPVQIKEGEEKNLLKGLDVRKNIKNGYTVVRLHYTADPDKDNSEFKTEARKLSGTKEKYEQEYEINWDVVLGDLIWSEFSRKHNIEKFKFDPTLSLIETWDPGVWTCCLISQLTEWGQLRIFDARLNIMSDASKIKLPQFLESYRKHQKINYPDPAFIIPIEDVAAKHTEALVEFTAHDLIKKHYGREPINHSLVNRKEEVLHLVSTKLLETVINPETKKHEKAIVIHPQAEKVIKTFTIGYKYKEQVDPSAQLTTRIDEVHPWEDIADCINYTVYWAFVKQDTEEQKEKNRVKYKAAINIYEQY